MVGDARHPEGSQSCHLPCPPGAPTQCGDQSRLGHGPRALVVSLLCPSISFLPCLFFFFLAAWHANFLDQGLNLLPLEWKHRVLTPGPPGNSLKNVFFIYKNLSVIKWICPRLRLMSIQKVEERGYPHLTAAGFTEHVPPSKTGDLEDFMSNHPPTCD